MRAVLDTNVLLSGLLWHGAPHKLLEQVRAGGLTLISSPALLAEFSKVIGRKKFKAILARSHASSRRLLEKIRLLAEIVDPSSLSAPVSRDPDDDAVLALAVAAGVDFIMSGDADPLVLESHVHIRIVTPVQALVLIGA